MDKIEYLKLWEQFRGVSYNDNPKNPKSGKWTLGWGFTELYGKPIVPGQAITQQQADAILVSKIGILQGQMGSVLKGLNQNQQDALIVLAYNVGVNGFPVLSQCLRNFDFRSAYEQFFDDIYQHGNPVKGLIYRRACDAQIFQSNVYERRDWITRAEQKIFLKMNTHNFEAATMITNQLDVH